MYFKNFVITSLLLVFFTACNDNDSTLFTPPESHAEFLDTLEPVIVQQLPTRERWYKYSLEKGSYGKKIVASNGSFFVAITPPIVSDSKVGFDSGSGISRSFDGVHWESTEIALPGVYHSIIFDGESFIAIGFSLLPQNVGSIIRSIDAIHWEEVSRTSLQLKDIIFNNGEYVAVGLGGLIVHSTDGITWNETIDQSNATLFSCVYGGSYMCGGDGAVLFSKDAKEWEQLNYGYDAFGIRKVLYTNHRYMVITSDYIATYDTYEWEAKRKEVNFNESIFGVYENSFMEFSDVVLSSQDGKIWTEVATLEALLDTTKGCEYYTCIMTDTAIIMKEPE